jgi:hypothetical protein
MGGDHLNKNSFNTSGDNHTEGLFLMEKICEENVKTIKTSRKIAM